MLYERLQSGELNLALHFRTRFDAFPQWLAALLDRFGLIDFETVERRIVAALAQASQLIATQAFAIGQNTFEFVASLFITLYLAFFLIRDGDEVVLTMRRAIPLPREQMQELVEKFITVIRATVKGNLLVAAIQGALGGLAFWFLGVTGALLWAVVMAFLSLLPAIGAALVWLPVAAYLLVGNDTRMPDYLVMMTTFGGMAVLGINGFVVGPAIAAMFIAVWHIYGTTRPGAAT